jgi:hypothetical protein
LEDLRRLDPNHGIFLYQDNPSLPAIRLRPWFQETNPSIDLPFDPKQLVGSPNDPTPATKLFGVAELSDLISPSARAALKTHLLPHHGPVASVARPPQGSSKPPYKIGDKVESFDGRKATIREIVDSNTFKEKVDSEDLAHPEITDATTSEGKFRLFIVEVESSRYQNQSLEWETWSPKEIIGSQAVGGFASPSSKDYAPSRYKVGDRVEWHGPTRISKGTVLETLLDLDPPRIPIYNVKVKVDAWFGDEPDTDIWPAWSERLCKEGERPSPNTSRTQTLFATHAG